MTPEMKAAQARINATHKRRDKNARRSKRKFPFAIPRADPAGASIGALRRETKMKKI
jgi:hypothetical protein